jgi:hypothetical protein
VAPLMQPKPPRLLPTLGLVVLWVALYFLWVAVRPTAPVVTTRPAKTATTTTTGEPLFKVKP